MVVLAALGLAAIVGRVRRRSELARDGRATGRSAVSRADRGVLIGVAATGNPLVGRAVRVISIAGVAIAWISAALGRRDAGARVRRLAAIAVIAATYLAAITVA